MGDNAWTNRSALSAEFKDDPRWASAAKAELTKILDSDYFGRAPKLERLLKYLAEQTLAGNASLLKSYVVGVDGLGKDPDFDPNIDSYPRVQVMRLRNMLETYYARHEPVGDMCIFIPAGSYGIRLARRNRAYPELIIGEKIASLPEQFERASFEGSNPHPYEDDAPPIPTASGSGRSSSFVHRSKWLLLSALAVSLALIGVYYPWKGDRQALAPATLLPDMQSPVMVVERPASPPDAKSMSLASEAYATLTDGIGRSWVVRLRLDDSNDEGSADSQADYRLAIQLSSSRETAQSVFLRLTDNRSRELLWSGSAEIDPAISVSDNLGKSIVQIAGPFGIISDRQNKAPKDAFAPGYSCLIGYLNFLNTQDRNLRQKLSQCLKREIANPRLEAVRLGLLSFQVVETAPVENRLAAFTESVSLAQRAIRSDPTEAYAHFAMARINFVTDNCAMGTLHTRHATDANPYDPILLAVLGNFAALCGDPSGETMLERAFAFRSPGESYARLSLILAAIRSRRIDRLPALSAEAENMPNVNPAYHYLCETLIAAAADDVPMARTRWRQFAAASAVPQGTPDEMMQPLIMSKKVRDRTIGYLQMKSVLPRAQLPIAPVTAVNKN